MVVKTTTTGANIGYRKAALKAAFLFGAPIKDQNTTLPYSGKYFDQDMRNSIIWMNDLSIIKF